MRRILSIFIVFISFATLKAQLSFEDNAENVVTIIPDKSTGLDAVYVVGNTTGVSISYDGAKDVKWSSFGANGAAYSRVEAHANSLSLNSADQGYIAEVDGRSHYYWIINYSNHAFSISQFDVALDECDCNKAVLSFVGNANQIVYYSINGRPETLNREIVVKYNSLDFDDASDVYQQIEMSQSFQYLGNTITVDAPLCSTTFSIYGDRFLQQWNNPLTAETPVVGPFAISAQTSASQTEHEADNEQKVIGASLGGSAPCEVTFNAAVTDGVSFYEWQLARNSDFDPIDDRYSQTELTYIFREQGTTYVRFFASDANSSCEFYSTVYEISIGESSLLCPNVFSPQASPGVNDEWKVSYKSLISFDCHIFNRWGVEVFSFSDPSIGWDGKFKGKYVPAGTYYYVIKARGADGRVYNLSGDINIINSKNNSISGSYSD